MWINHLANSITVGRMILSFSLLIVKPLESTFFLIYIICGLSDIADGYIARKTKTESRWGARLDSFSDLIMVGIVLMIVLPTIELQLKFVIWIGFIIGIRFLSMFVVALKHKTFGILHTYANKLTGLLLFMYPLILRFNWAEKYLSMLCVVGTLSALEELFIHLSSNKLELNRKHF